MNQGNAQAELAEGDEEELDRAIDELRGVLREDATPVGGAGFAMSGDEDADTGDSASGIIMNIPVDVQIVLGSTEMQVADLMALRKGATVALDRRIGEPVDVVVNGRKIARGEITVLESDPSRFGIKLTEIVTSAKKS
ncbi:flagellar motor switch protein FliN [Aquibium oceanicum]|uniref:Flagellar motor switch protein FliN n=1 Tax=Aquibium oceanicum TaxID=1670800 RepID=A0A1L3SW09_9HYPH|nr:flagellar motor switch protein FliN [Aquibium oceanicum]APH73616.1 flagellar motor switch protein FliN [Aquibium oceanicum]